MFNVEADFNKHTREPCFKESKWQHPVEAATKIELGDSDGRLAVTIHFDADRQNLILVQHGHKKIKKNKRLIEFGDIDTAREFIF